MLCAIVGLISEASPARAADTREALDRNANDSLDANTIKQVRRLVRSTLTALHHANVTGNFSVLRQLGNPTWQTKFTVSKLSKAFGSLRERKIDLSPVVHLEPLMKVKVMEGGGVRTTGYYGTQPLRIIFAVSFTMHGEQWRIASLAVNAVPEERLSQKKPNRSAAPLAKTPSDSANAEDSSSALPQMPSFMPFALR